MESQSQSPIPSVTTGDTPAASISPRAASSAVSLPSLSAFTSSSSPGPASNHPRRPTPRAAEVSPQPRRRPVSMISLPSPDRAYSPTQGMRRRSSTLSEFSLNEARRSFNHGTQNILNPGAVNSESVWFNNSAVLSSGPLAFALLPALAGLFIEGAGAVITDLMLLGLVFIFLRYTIRQPWQWYHETQELRIKHEVGFEHVLDEESDTGIPEKMTASVSTLDDVPEEIFQDAHDSPHRVEVDSVRDQQEKKPSLNSSSRTRSQEAAVNELYVHEVLALLSCFISPIIGAYLLHAIRRQLSQPSEGLLTDFNITVFLLFAELRPMSHALKLIQARTLHLQRIVQSVPVAESTASQLEGMRRRLMELELRAEANEEATAASITAATQQAQQLQNSGTGSNKHDAIVREVRNAIQPELDALNRAVRRYERKATVLAIQTESRLGAVDTKLNDAISLAAVAVKQNTTSQPGFGSLVSWAMAWVVTIVTLPYHVAMFVIMWPFRKVARVCFERTRSGRDTRTTPGKLGRNASLKGTRNGSGSDRDRFRDRVPSRLSRR